MIKYKVQELPTHKFVVEIDPFGRGLQFGWYGGDSPEQFDKVHHVRTLNDEQLMHLNNTIVSFLSTRKPLIPLIEGDLR